MKSLRKDLNASEFELPLLRSIEKRWVVKPVEKGVFITKPPISTRRCVGCLSCMIACSITNEGLCNPSTSRIKVKNTVIEWLMGKGESSHIHPFEQVVCKQCPGISPCMAVCPVEGAIGRDPRTGAVVVNHEACIRCKRCVEACPYHACWYSDSNKRILKCELCGGDPACVKACPPHILEYVHE